MKYKMIEDGKSIEVDEKGLPIVVDDDEKEFGIDAIHLYSKIPALQEEAKNHRLKANGFEEKLNAFKEIEDPAAAIEALLTVNQLKSGDLKDKKELDRIKLETEDAWKGKLSDLQTSHGEVIKDKDGKINVLEGEVFNALVSSQFTKSEFFSGKEPITNMIPAVAESYFGRCFKAEKTEAGKRQVIGYLAGLPIYSKKRPGEYADFDEAIGMIIEAEPDKASMLHGSVGSGSHGGSAIVRGKHVQKGDNKSFLDNVLEIASGKVHVVS